MRSCTDWVFPSPGFNDRMPTVDITITVVTSGTGTTVNGSTITIAIIVSLVTGVAVSPPVRGSQGDPAQEFVRIRIINEFRKFGQ